mmetsp:Transcript_36420/g.95859  ORF Transcript_36420/g.95859 Transcript_36420/m.95859 type:complete len:1446 (-) Transcript_36420:59-4396(-)
MADYPVQHFKFHVDGENQFQSEQIYQVAEFHRSVNSPWIASKTGSMLVAITSSAATDLTCPQVKSSFLVSFYLACPVGFYGAGAGNCTPCNNACGPGQTLLSSCNSTSTEDTTICGCPEEQYSPSNYQKCTNCSTFCKPGELLSDYHFCKVGSTTNTQVCSKLLPAPSGGFQGLRVSLSALSAGDDFAIPAGYYTGSENCQAEIWVDNVTVRAAAGRGSVVIDCAGQARQLVVGGANVRIQGLVFRNGRAVSSNLPWRRKGDWLSQLESGLTDGNSDNESSSDYTKPVTDGPTLRAFDGSLSSHGGCLLYLSFDGVVTDSDFDGCSADGNGGAVAIPGPGGMSLTLTGTSIRRSSAMNGAGVWSSGASLILDNCSLEGNKATVLGGGLFLDSLGSTAILGNTTFARNRAYHGGAIQTGSGLELAGRVQFTDNFAEDQGGAILQRVADSVCPPDANGQPLVVKDSVRFHGNQAASGGAIAACFVVAVDFTSFAGNYASFQGGAVYLSQNGSAVFDGSVMFEQNRALMSGGAVYGSASCNIRLSGNASFWGNAVGYISEQEAQDMITLCPFGACFMSGGALYSGTSTETLIEGNVRFVGNHVGSFEGSVQTGGAVQIDSTFGTSRLTVTDNVVFQGNSVGDMSISPYDFAAFCSLQPCAFYGGGAIGAYGYNAHVDITIGGQVHFIGNAATSGGAILCRSECALHVGGSVVFNTNRAWRGFGGAIASISSTVRIAANVSFIQNSASSPNSEPSGGGAVYAQCVDCSDLNATTEGLVISGNVGFSANEAKGYGGALYVKACSCTVAGSTGQGLLVSGAVQFIKNTASNGGAVYVYSAGSVTFSFLGRVIFKMNSADSGGAIFALASSPAVGIVSESIFEKNSASVDGGAIYLSYVTALRLARSSRLNSNTAASRGGAVFATSGSCIYAIDNSLLFGNSALDGGAVYISASTVVLADNVAFLKNHAGGQGGGLYSSESRIVSMGHALFANNSASVSGGAIVASGGTMTLGNSLRFLGNEASGYGGALYCRTASTSEVSGVTFEANVAGDAGGGMAVSGASVAISNSMFRSNVALSGGGLLLMDDSVATVTGGTMFVNNSGTGAARACVNSKCSGGAMAVRGTSQLVMNNSALVGNRATGNGAALYVSDHATVVSSATVAGNVAEGNGGGFASEGYSTVTILDGSVFWNNSAAQDGGCGYFAGLKTEIAGSLLIQLCTAGGNGGGIFASSEVEISGVSSTTTVKSCTANIGGGIAMSGSEAELAIYEHSRLQLVDNLARQNGGGLALLSSAYLEVESQLCSTTCPSSSRGNGVCDVDCLTAECNWDDGDCAASAQLDAKCVVPGTSNPVTNSTVPDCWKTPLSVIGNLAKSNGGGAYLDGCGEDTSPCGFTGMPPKSGAVRVLFEANVARGAGGGIYSVCETFQSSCQLALGEHLGVGDGNESKRYVETH